MNTTVDLSQVRSVIISPPGPAPRHGYRLQYTRYANSEQWLMTQDDHNWPQPVGTDHVERSIIESHALGDNITLGGDDITVIRGDPL